MSANNFFSELQRRNVPKAAVTFIAIAWVILQAASIILPILNAPEGAMRFILISLTILFPAWLVFAWIYEFTPQGFRKTDDEDLEAQVVKDTDRTMNSVIIASLSLAVILLVADRIFDITDQFFEPEVEKSIAVLPFVNMNDEPQNEYFCDGITEDIQNRLSYLDDLKIISRTTSMQFKSTDLSVSDIAANLGVRYILEGSVRKSNDRVRISARLVEAADNKQIWSESFDRDLDDIFAIQSEVSMLIANSLRANISSQDSILIESVPTSNTLAYEYYLRALEQTYIRSEESLENSVRLYKMALDEDPNFLYAKADLAKSLYLQGYFAYENQWILFPKVETMLREILAVDPNSFKALALKATLDIFFRRWDEGIQNFKKSLLIKPNDADILHQYGQALLILGDLEKSHDYTLRAISLEPLSPIFQVALGLNLIHSGKLDQGQEQIDKIDQLFPEYFFNYLNKGDLYFLKGQYENAKAAYEKFQELNPVMGQFMTGYQAASYALSGEEEKAREIMKNNSLDNVEYHSMIAYGHIGLNQLDSAAYHFDLALDNYEVNVCEMLHHPIYLLFDDHPAFPILLKKAGLYAYWKPQQSVL